MSRNDKKLHRLRYWREKVGLKQDDLAILLGCKRSCYCRKENGSAEIRLSEMLKIQMAINKKIETEYNEEHKLTLDEIFT